MAKAVFIKDGKSQTFKVSPKVQDALVGSFNTICVKPRLQTEGIFQRKGDIYIWLTDDDRKMPVMMRSSVKIGPVKATLIQT